MKALISVYDKRGIEEFASQLVNLGWDLISTGGTYDKLKEAGLPVTKVEDVTGFPEILSGRVKSLHPHIHAGILYQRDKSEDRETMKEKGIESIDMVVNNLYPFEASVKSDPDDLGKIIENIDIGGPAMIRAAAKNYRDVIVVTDPDDYASVIEDLTDQTLGLEKRQVLAAKAFSLTAYYDAMIATYFNSQSDGQSFPKHLTKAYRFDSSLRYGENPHQKAVYYKSPLEADIEIEQLHGKQISYNNYNDMKAALDLVYEFEETACVAVKHANPCGVALGQTPGEAYQKAYDCDPVSIYGGIIAFNRPVDLEAAEKLAEIFLEVVIAPDFSEPALDKLSQKKNIRLVKYRPADQSWAKRLSQRESLAGLLVQERNLELISPEGLKLVTDRPVTDRELEDLKFAWKVAKHSASNAMIIAKDGQTIGLGHGEVRRVWALESALERSEFDLTGSVIASDGFFFTDTIENMQKYGIKAIIQPGGSIQDEKVIELAKEYDISVLMTGMRHFKH